MSLIPERYADSLDDLWMDDTTPPSEDRYAAFQERYHNRPDLFVQECILWTNNSPGPNPYQLDIMMQLVSERRVTVRGPHGLGKTALASWIVLWFALTRDGYDWKIPTTASAWRQLSKFLWPEIKKWARRLDWERIGRGKFVENREMFGLNLRLKTGEAFAVASNDSNLIEGAHASSDEVGKGGILYVFDEAKVIPPETWDSAEGAMSTPGENTFWLAISTPGEPSGRFYDIHQRADGYEDWSVRHVTLGEAIAAGRVGKQWAQRRERQWGKDSAIYINRVLGDFASSDVDAIIPLSHVELAVERWESWNDSRDSYSQIVTRIGVDVARQGVDKTILAERRDNIVDKLIKHSKGDTMETTGHVTSRMNRHPDATVCVEVVGVGAGVFDRLRELHGSAVVHEFNPAKRTDRMDKSKTWGFANVRAAAWWHMRELLDPANGYDIALPPDEDLIKDLITPKWKALSGGKILVESKEDIKRRRGKSPDEGDAVVIAFWEDFASYGMEWA
jgi:hypothetical protein